MGTKKPEAMKK